jgi:hypothetical protein
MERMYGVANQIVNLNGQTSQRRGEGRRAQYRRDVSSNIVFSGRFAV